MFVGSDPPITTSMATVTVVLSENNRKLLQTRATATIDELIAQFNSSYPSESISALYADSARTQKLPGTSQIGLLITARQATVYAVSASETPITPSEPTDSEHPTPSTPSTPSTPYTPYTPSCSVGGALPTDAE